MDEKDEPGCILFDRNKVHSSSNNNTNDSILKKDGRKVFAQCHCKVPAINTTTLDTS